MESAGAFWHVPNRGNYRQGVLQSRTARPLAAPQKEKAGAASDSLTRTDCRRDRDFVPALPGRARRTYGTTGARL